MAPLHLFTASRGTPFFLRLCCALALSLGLLSAPADEIHSRRLPGASAELVRESLIEAIESEGLLVGNILPFGEMLVRTRQAGNISPYRQAEIVQFCSSRIAWQLVAEAPDNLALCPMSVALYVLAEKPEEVVLSWRELQVGVGSAGRTEGDALLRKIIERTVALADLR